MSDNNAYIVYYKIDKDRWRYYSTNNNTTKMSVVIVTKIKAIKSKYTLLSLSLSL
jgi:hypothetical protein